MEYEVGDQVKLSTDDSWNGLYGVIENIYKHEGKAIYAVFCVPMAGFGCYFARESNLGKERAPP